MSKGDNMAKENTTVHNSRNIFFVFQNKTYKQESEGGFLWAPKENKKGQKFGHWSLMAEINKNDIIIHCANKQIKAISVAKADVYEDNKPSTFETDWEEKGWKVNCEYLIIPNPIDMTDHRDKLFTLQPDEKAPLDKNHNGNQGYLFKANSKMLEYILSETMLINDSKTQRKLSKLDIDLNELNEHKQDERELEAINSDENLAENADTHIKNEPRAKKELVTTSSGTKYPRDIKVAKNALKLANFKCEGVNKEKGEKEHFVFARKADPEITYTEPHHLIPLSNHKDFENSLDVEANIVSLCSNCHKLIHYGKDYKQLLEILYEQRKDKLKEAGIEVSWEQLLSYYE